MLLAQQLQAAKKDSIKMMQETVLSEKYVLRITLGSLFEQFLCFS